MSLGGRLRGEEERIAGFQAANPVQASLAAGEVLLQPFGVGVRQLRRQVAGQGIGRQAFLLSFHVPNSKENRSSQLDYEDQVRNSFRKKMNLIYRFALCESQPAPPLLPERETINQKSRNSASS